MGTLSKCFYYMEMKEVRRQVQRWEPAKEEGAEGSEDRLCNVCRYVCVVCVWKIFNEWHPPICEKFWWVKFVNFISWREMNKLVGRRAFFLHRPLLLRCEGDLGYIAATSLGNLWEMQILRLHLWPTKSKCVFIADPSPPSGGLSVKLQKYFAGC